MLKPFSRLAMVALVLFASFRVHAQATVAIPIPPAPPPIAILIAIVTAAGLAVKAVYEYYYSSGPVAERIREEVIEAPPSTPYPEPYPAFEDPTWASFTREEMPFFDYAKVASLEFAIRHQNEFQTWDRALAHTTWTYRGSMGTTDYHDERITRPFGTAPSSWWNYNLSFSRFGSRWSNLDNYLWDFGFSRDVDPVRPARGQYSDLTPVLEVPVSNTENEWFYVRPFDTMNSLVGSISMVDTPLEARRGFWAQSRLPADQAKFDGLMSWLSEHTGDDYVNNPLYSGDYCITHGTGCVWLPGAWPEPFVSSGHTELGNSTIYLSTDPIEILDKLSFVNPPIPSTLDGQTHNDLDLDAWTNTQGVVFHQIKFRLIQQYSENWNCMAPTYFDYTYSYCHPWRYTLSYNGISSSRAVIGGIMVLPHVITEEVNGQQIYQTTYVYRAYSIQVPASDVWVYVGALREWWSNYWVARLYGVNTAPIEVNGGSLTLPWDEAGSLDYGTSIRARDGASVSWIVNPVQALQAAFIPQTPFVDRFARVSTNLSDRFPFSITTALQAPAVTGSASTLVMDCFEVGNNERVCPAPGVLQFVADFTRNGATVLILVGLGLWLRRRLTPTLKL